MNHDLLSGDGGRGEDDEGLSPEDDQSHSVVPELGRLEKLYGEGLLVVEEGGAPDRHLPSSASGYVHDDDRRLSALDDAGNRLHRQDLFEARVSVVAKVERRFASHHHEATAVPDILLQACKLRVVLLIVQDHGLVPFAPCPELVGSERGCGGELVLLG